jgi:hypothetical protein
MAGRLAAGAAASFAGTLASARLIRQVERDRSFLPYAAYRTGLALAVLARRPPGRPRTARRGTWETRGR